MSQLLLNLPRDHGDSPTAGDPIEDGGSESGDASEMVQDIAARPGEEGPEFDPSLSIRNLPLVIFDRDVERQIVYYRGRVLRGCLCAPTCGPDIVAHSPVVMSNAHEGFAIEPSDDRYLHYDGVSIVFARPWGGQFMQPSIDTILACRGLAQLFASGPLNFANAIEVGSGSGFIGKYAAAKAPGTTELQMTLVDIDPKAKSYCASTRFGAQSTGAAGRPVRWNLCVGDAIPLLKADSSFDLVVANPPYIPTKEEVETERLTFKRGFWEGCGLLVFLMEHMLSGYFPTHAHLVLVLTSLSLKCIRVRQLLDEARERGFQVNVLLEREVAWKAWYAGRGSSPNFLLSRGRECSERALLGDREFFVGATQPGESRAGGRRDSYLDYHWHVAYVLDIFRAPESHAASTKGAQPHRHVEVALAATAGSAADAAD